MIRRGCISLSFVIGALLLTGLPAAGQPARSSPELQCTGPAEPWVPPRTHDGQPDLQGVWLSNSAIPLERPAALKDRARFTDEEVAEFTRRAKRIFEHGDSDFAVAEGMLAAVLENPEVYQNPNSTGGADSMVELRFENRTSLIVDPSDGRVPSMTAGAIRRQELAAAARRRLASSEDLNLAQRCLSWGMPRLGGRYGAGDMAYYQIFQAPGYVVLYIEAGHEARIIPLDGRPHLRPAVGQWSGDSRGHWEGNTLVVDTVNFSPKSDFRGAGEHLHVVERFSRTAPDAIQYEITLDDPTTWTRPWTATIPLQLRQEHLFEAACHEGNGRLIPGMILGARTQEGRQNAPE